MGHGGSGLMNRDPFSAMHTSMFSPGFQSQHPSVGTSRQTVIVNGVRQSRTTTTTRDSRGNLVTETIVEDSSGNITREKRVNGQLLTN